MKKKLFKRSLWQSILSISIFGVFVFIASGSLYTLMTEATPKKKVESLGGRVVKTTYFDPWDDDRDSTIYIGNRNFDGNYYGAVTIKEIDRGYLSRTEEVNFVDGKKHGQAKITYISGYVYYMCYHKGVAVDCEKAAHISLSDTTAFDVLSNKYPSFLFSLNAFGFDDVYVKAYMDTIESIMASNDFEVIDFDEYYSDAIEALLETHYDSIIMKDSYLSYILASESLKHSEFRLAVVNSYKMESPNTFEVVQSVYPGYLSMMDSIDIDHLFFKDFCTDFDSIMNGYGALDWEEPLYPDSIDTRLGRALTSILSYEDTTATSLLLKSGVKINTPINFNSLRNKALPILKQLSIRPGSQEAALYVFVLMLMEYDQNDIIKQVVKQAYLARQGIVSPPTVTTEFLVENSNTSVELKGYVIENGGGEITERGIAWATYFNPTIEDQTLISGSGLGQYTVNLAGLDPGTTYYARSYATNSAGTAYGNCISFVAGATGAIATGDDKNDFVVYPNPASEKVTFSFQIESSENTVLTIVNMNGQLVYEYHPGKLAAGQNQVEVNVSSMTNGMYNCRLVNGNKQSTKQLLIAR